MSRFVARKKVERLPRLPLRGTIDLTYRCANDCRHCWLRLPPGAPERTGELTADEIRRVAAEARALGCREWAISGGEPLLRPDFPEIFEALTERAAWYTLNTNGGLITPAIARMLRRPGTLLVALYGATAPVHDAVTRNPGSFEALERGVARLREAGVPFTVQVVPMRTNFAGHEAMVRLAESWSRSWRIGATWLYLSASGDPVKDREIAAERLAAAEIAGLDPARDGGAFDEATGCAAAAAPDAGLYAACLAGRRDFHVDPYGGLSFCSFVKDPALRVDLRTTPLAEAWEERLPALAGAAKPSPAYHETCGACELRSDCKWCPVFAWLEHRDHSARIDSLCALARETRRARTAWTAGHRRRYRVAGLAVDVESDLPFADGTFAPKFAAFRAPADEGPADVVLSHHFALPELDGRDLGRLVYRRAPWAVYRRDGSWTYLMLAPGPDDRDVRRVMVFDDGHTRGRVFHPSEEAFLAGGWDSLALLASDQLVLARTLPAFGGLFVHAAGVVVDGRGLVFAGASGAGKSTLVGLLGGRAEVLCDDRVALRRGEGGWRVHGTWNHGDDPRVSPGSAPAAAVFFLRQARENRVDRLSGTRDVLAGFLPRLVRPLTSADWLERALDLAGEIVREVPFYELSFDRSGAVAGVLEGFLAREARP